AIGCASLAALFWAVNPLRVEGVAWASSRIYEVAFLFATLWLLAWLRANDPDVPAPRQNLLRYAALVAYAASLLTYPLALFAPVAMLGWQILSSPNPLR